MLAFERPLLLILLALVPGFILLRRFLRSRGSALAFPFDGGRGEASPRPPFIPRVFRIGRDVGIALALAACVVAAAGPALVSRRVLYLSRGNEVIFVLDLSPSMAASDVAPSRLDAAKAIIDDFLSSRHNETVGLVAFGNEAALICPPTTDYVALAKRLATLSPGIYGDGTAIGAGIATAVAHAARSSAPEKHIVLLTDGENNAGAMDPGTAAAAAARYGIVLSVVGVGSRGEVPLTYVDPQTGEKHAGSYRSDFDPDALERLARSGGGQYYAAENRQALASAFSALSERSASLVRTRTMSIEEPLTRIFLFLALAAAVCARLFGLAGGGGRP